MLRPVNNLALSLSELPMKIFVKESVSTSEIEKSNKYKLQFEGNEAKLAYDEIISAQTNNNKSLPHVNEKTKKFENHSKSSNKHANKKIENVNILFKAIESRDKDFVYQHFNPENVNISDQFGWTPLMCAAYSGYMEIVNFLIKLGADIKIRDKSGFTAIDLALKKNYLDIVNLLKQNLFKKNIKKKNAEICVEQYDNKCDQNIANEKTEFYCDVCKMVFNESSVEKHETSTLHIFNSKPKLMNAFYGIPKQNKGYQMLLNTGWNEEGGLGPSGKGQKYPVKTILKRDREGLGRSNKNLARITHFVSSDINAIKFTNEHKKKKLKKKDQIKKLNKEADKVKALRQALS